MKILVTGSRGRVSEWDRLQLFSELDDIAPYLVIHGECKNSPDWTAREWVWQDEIAMEKPFPADWEQYGKKAGYVRNVQMLNLGKPDLVLAQWDGKSRGTLHMITEATAWGVPVRILPPQKRET